MLHRTNAVARCAAVALGLGLAGCSVIDDYSWRAVDYNREAEQAQQQVLLLNIVRASLRRPMQFTSLQTVTGSANVAGSVNGGAQGVSNTPLISRFGLTPAPTSTVLSRILTGNVTGNVNMGGSATFTVPILDTQEFYRGILTPIPLQAFDYYLQQGYPAELLFDLLVLKVEVTRLDDGSCRKFTFQNSVRNDLEFGQFHAFIDYMIGSGLMAERVNSIKAYGPPIPQPAVGPQSVEATAKVLEAYSKASTAGLDIRQEGRGENARYRVQKRSSIFRFCFASPGGTPSDWIGSPNSTMFCGHFNRRGAAATAADDAGGAPEGANECVPRGRATRARTGAGEDGGERDYDSRSQGVNEGGVSEFRGIRLAPEFLRRMDRLQAAARAQGAPEDALFDTRHFAGGIVSFKVYTRSTEGILYYLGEVTRRRLFTEFGDQPRTIQVKTGLRYGTFPLDECYDSENGGSWQERSDLAYLSRRRANSRPGGRFYCENLFVVDTGGGGDQVVGVAYDGKYFSIPRDQNRSGRTLQVLELVKQLLALNTSAKELPTTSVISVVGQ